MKNLTIILTLIFSLQVNAFTFANYSSVYTGIGGETSNTLGSKDEPCSVSAVKTVYVEGSSTPAWVVGYIVGSVDGMNFTSDAVFGPVTETAYNILISDNPNVISVDECIPVQLPSSVRVTLNLASNPSNYGKKVKLKGNVEAYFGVAGLKSVVEYEFLNIDDIKVNLSGINYKIISDTEVQVIAIETEYKDTIIIPNEIIVNEKKYNVTSIGNFAFYNCSGLTSITIPNSVTSIGDGAFYGCTGLTSVMIGNAVASIGEYTFYGCIGLTSITIPNSVTNIGEYTFESCTGLTSVTIGNAVTSIGDGAFSGCTGLVSVEFNAENCMTIGNASEHIFNGCIALSTVSFGENVKTIPDYAFSGCTGLTIVTIGNSVISIGSNAFNGCYKINKIIWLTNTPPEGYTELSSKVHYVANNHYTGLKNVNIYPYLSSMFEVDGIKYVPVSPSERTCDAIDCAFDCTIINIENTVSYKGIDMTVKDIKPYTCYSNKNMKYVKINCRGNIWDYAFYGCYALEYAEIKASNIGKETFSDCSALKTLIVNAENIGDYAFKDCTNVKSIILSDNLTIFGKNVFENCSNLEEIVIPNTVVSMGEYAFSKCSSLVNVTIGTGVTTINKYTFAGCSKLPNITIPSNVESIDDYVFDNCTSLTQLTITDRNTDLLLGSNGSNPLFYSCPLDSVYIGGNISYSTTSSKGYSPFYRNTKLRSVVITHKETEISKNEFYGCTNLQNFSMGDGVEMIGDWAFSGCSSLEYFAFGSGLKSIGDEAFSDCTAMTKLISKTNIPPSCGTQALDDINKWSCELYVPQLAVYAYQNAEQWKEFFFIIGETSGINDILYNDVYTPIEYHNLQGVRVENPEKGVYIKRQGGKTTKVVK